MTRRLLAWLGLLVGIGALALQFSISIPAWSAQNVPLGLALVRFFSYFTILTNIGLVLVFMSELAPSTRVLGLFRGPQTRATLAAAIALVMGFYHFVLAGLWQPQGLFLVCDLALHYVTPTLYLFWFAAFKRTGTLRWLNLPAMLVAPLAYLAYIMVRGAIVTEYPYPVLEAHRIGYAQVALNVAGIIVIFCLLAAVAIFIDRQAPNHRTPS